MESKTTRTRVREKFSFGKDIYMKLYMGDGLRTLARWTVARRTDARRTLARATRVRNKQ